MLKLLLYLFLPLCPLPLEAQGDGGRGIPVLVYHRFDPIEAGATTVRTDNLVKQMDWLQEHGYSVVPLQNVVDMVSHEGGPAKPHTIAITVDDGHQSIYTVLYPIIKARHIPITLFIYSSVISHASYALTWEQLQEMKSSGLVRIESHTLWHPDFRREQKRLDASAYQSFVDNQLLKSKAILERQLGIEVRLLAWPYGIFDDNLITAAKQAGYVAAFAYDGKIATADDPKFVIHRIPVLDHPGLAGFPVLQQNRQEKP